LYGKERKEPTMIHALEEKASAFNKDEHAANIIPSEVNTLHHTSSLSMTKSLVSASD
jgi:hypothetical protein